MAAGTYNLVIDQGSDFGFEFVVKEDGVAKDLTGYSARGQLRRKKTSPNISGTFTCTITDAANGTGTVSMDNTTTTSLTPGWEYYDVELYTAGDSYVERILEGRVEIRAEVTR